MATDVVSKAVGSLGLTPGVAHVTPGAVDGRVVDGHAMWPERVATGPWYLVSSISNRFFPRLPYTPGLSRATRRQVADRGSVAPTHSGVWSVWSKNKLLWCRQVRVLAMAAGEGGAAQRARNGGGKQGGAQGAPGGGPAPVQLPLMIAVALGSAIGEPDCAAHLSAHNHAHTTACCGRSARPQDALAATPERVLLRPVGRDSPPLHRCLYPCPFPEWFIFASYGQLGAAAPAHAWAPMRQHA